jgi:hypothetical protein
MADSKNSEHGAKVLTDLSPVEFYPFALYIPAYEDPKHYKKPYRRYRTLAHARVAGKGFRDVMYYEFNFENECWEEVNG